MKYTYAHSSGKTQKQQPQATNKAQGSKSYYEITTTKKLSDSKIAHETAIYHLLIYLFKGRRISSANRKIMRIARMSRGKLFSKVGFTDLMIESDIIRYRIHSDGSLTGEFQGVDLKFSLKPG